MNITFSHWMEVPWSVLNVIITMHDCELQFKQRNMTGPCAGYEAQLGLSRTRNFPEVWSRVLRAMDLRFNLTFTVKSSEPILYGPRIFVLHSYNQSYKLYGRGEKQKLVCRVAYLADPWVTQMGAHQPKIDDSGKHLRALFEITERISKSSITKITSTV